LYYNEEKNIYSDLEILKMSVFKLKMVGINSYTLNIFLFFNFNRILELVYLEILNQFSFSSFEICRFNFFNQILLSLFDVLYAFQNYI